MNINAVKTRIFKEGEDLLAFVTKNIPKLKNGSVLVVTSKIVALSEGRTAPVQDRKKIIRAESNWALESKYVSLTEKGGMILANAGVDESNADGKLVLLPKDSFKTAQKIRSNILQNVRIRKLGVIISDSRVMPLRAGVVGVALGYAGFKGVRDYRGKKRYVRSQTQIHTDRYCRFTRDRRGARHGRGERAAAAMRHRRRAG